METWHSRIEPVLNAALRQRDNYTADHCERVASLALLLAMAQALQLTQRDKAALGIAARFHDLGKIGLPDTVLLKVGPLDADEWTLMKTHSARGAEIVRADGHLAHRNDVALAIRHHHEHYDGKGYPDGLRGKDIPLLSRVISVVDSYDAMTTRRPYQASRSHHETMLVLTGERGTKHDPEILDVFLSLDEGSFEPHSDSR